MGLDEYRRRLKNMQLRHAIFRSAKIWRTVACCTFFLSYATAAFAGMTTVGCFDSRMQMYSVGSSWNDTFNGKQYVCRCTSGGGSCSPVNSSSGSSGSSGHSGLSYKHQMQLDIMQSVMDSAANAFIRWLNEPSSPAKRQKTPEELAAEQAKREQEKAAWREKVEQQIAEMQAQYQSVQQQQVINKRSKLLAGLKGLTSNSAEPHSDLLEQLRCKAYWGFKASKAVDLKQAQAFSRLAESPDADALTECAQELPQPPEPSSPDDFRTELYQTVVQQINERLPLIEQAMEKQRTASSQLEERQQQVDELKNRQETAASVEEKQSTEDLLAAALQELEAATALKNEADAGVMKLKLEVDALKDVESIAANPNGSTSREGLTQ